VHVFDAIKRVGWVYGWSYRQHRARYATVPYEPAIELAAHIVAASANVPVYYAPNPYKGVRGCAGAFYWYEHTPYVVVRDTVIPSYRVHILLHELGHALRPNPFVLATSLRDFDLGKEEMIVEGAAMIIQDEIFGVATPRSIKASAAYVAVNYNEKLRRQNYLAQEYAKDVYDLVGEFVKYGLLSRGVG